MAYTVVDTPNTLFMFCRSLTLMLSGILMHVGAQAQSLINNPPAGTPVPGELIVKLNPHVKPHDLTLPGFLPAGQLEWESILSELSHIHLFSYDDVALDGEEVLDALRASVKVQAAQLNHYVEDRATPNDPQFGSQWHHIDASDNDIDSDLAWDITTGGTTANGDRIVVAVLEGGGANYNHVDLILSLIHI